MNRDQVDPACYSYGKVFFSMYFAREDNVCDMMFASVNYITLQIGVSTLKGRICSYGSKFLPFRVNPH